VRGRAQAAVAGAGMAYRCPIREDMNQPPPFVAPRCCAQFSSPSRHARFFASPRVTGGAVFSLSALLQRMFYRPRHVALSGRHACYTAACHERRCVMIIRLPSPQAFPEAAFFFQLWSPAFRVDMLRWRHVWAFLPPALPPHLPACRLLPPVFQAFPARYRQVEEDETYAVAYRGPAYNHRRPFDVAQRRLRRFAPSRLKYDAGAREPVIRADTPNI